MRNVQLQDLVEQVKGRVGQSTLASAGLDDLNAMQMLVRSIQEQLFDEHDWPHLTVERYKQLNPGQLEYDLPTDVDYEEIVSVSLYQNSVYTELDRGIGPDDYTGFDSLNNTVRSDPTLKWDIRSTEDDAVQIVVWPTPSSTDMQLFIKARRKLRPLISKTDLCDLDSTLIVLTAAAEILYDQENTGKAQRIEKLAISRLARLKSRTKTASQAITMRGGTDWDNRRRGPRIIAVR